MTPLQKSILNAVKRRPMTLRELQNNLQVDNSRLRTTVSAMVATGELSMRNGTYVPGFATYENAAAPNTIPCTLVKLAARFGFASRDDGEGDIFIPGRALHGAMPNDKINVKLFDHPRVEGSSEGEVVEVTVPNNRFAGTVCLSEDGRMAVEPDGCRDVKFLLAKQGSEGVHLGDKVGFLITHRGNRHSDHRAAVVEKFGSSDYASECAKAILYGRSVRQEFPPEVLEEARAYDNATIDPAEAAKRLVLRKARGGMDIESNEAKLVMDENGRCIDIVKRDRGTSECMIEEFMLLANQCAANAGRTNKAPFVYRVHEAPDAEKMEKLSATLLACGLNAKFKNPIPTQLELAALLDETRGQPIQIPVHTGILRSMQKARYAPQPLGHYGLVLADYAHFTSPIRRYPDLAIHRILTEMLNGVSASQLQRDFNEFAQQASEKSSKQEVAAVRIERDVEDLYKAEYMHNHLGEVYTGTVAGITPRGVFVELDNTVEGFVPAAQLCKGEPQVIDGVSMLDPLTGKSWMLGSSMKIRVAAADVALGRIDFEYMVE